MQSHTQEYPVLKVRTYLFPQKRGMEKQSDDGRASKQQVGECLDEEERGLGSIPATKQGLLSSDKSHG